MPDRPGRYIPFSYKMMVPYLLLVMMTDIIVGYFSYHSAVQSRTELVQANAAGALRQMRDNTRYQMADLQAVSDSLFSSPSYQSYLQVAGDRAAVYETTMRGLLPLMETPLKMTAQNLRMIVYVTNSRIDEIHGNLNMDIQDKSYALLSINRLSSQSWHADMVASGEDNVWRQVDNDAEFGNLSLLRKLISFTDYQTEIGFLRITVPMKELFHSLLISGISQDSIIQVVDERENRVLFSNAPDRELSAKDGRFLTIAEEIPNTDLVLRANIPISALHQDAGRIGLITLSVCGISFVVMAVMAFLVAQYSGRSIKHILSCIRLFQAGQFSKRLALTGNDEFAQISAAFNRMAQNIDELIREVYLQGIQKKEAELTALQAQINPHFLYNTLSSINSLAHIGETKKLGAMVAGLARFYRLTLNEETCLSRSARRSIR
ncbi:histidine kinase [Paenibacillus sp. CC-CFT747]|nr:histidine kinase [Paenibacillus sp. CC-CFT747]